MVSQLKIVKLMFMAFAGVGVFLFLLGFVMGVAKTPVLFSLCGFGLIFAAVGGIPLYRSSKKQKAQAALRENGLRVWSEITRVEVNSAVTVNGSHPRVIICESKDAGGTPRVFKSSNIYALIPSTVVGQPIMVFVSKDDPSQYLVDISSFTGA